MKKHRVLSFLMSILLATSLISPYFIKVSAIELNVNKVITNIQASYPDAEIYIDSSNTISVFVPVSATNPYTYMSTNASSTRQKSPNGGTFIYRYHPPYLFLTSPICLPISKTYMPSQITSDVYITMLEPSVVDEIMDLYLVGKTASFIRDAIKTKFNINIGPESILCIVTLETYNILSALNRNAYKRAMDNSTSGKVMIEQTTSDGYAVLYYFSWNDDYVDATPWEDCSPTFNEGVYFN